MTTIGLAASRAARDCNFENGGNPQMNWFRKTAVLAAMIAACTALAACGSSSSDSTSTSSSSSSSSSGDGKADLAAAEELTSPFSGQPTPFPVDEPLKERPPASTTIAFMQCATPFCALMAEQLKAATAAMGIEFSVVKAGASVKEQQGAMSSIIAQKPDAVVVPAVEESIPQQLQELDEMEIPVAGAGVMYPEEYGIDLTFNDAEVASQVARALAGWTIEEKGEEADAVFYTTPELGFSSVVEEAFEGALTELCSACSVRSVTIPLSEFGNDAPGHVVSDLQANPETNVVIFGSQEGAEGLSAQMRVAGLEDIVINGYGGTPSNLQDIQAGSMTATMAVDTNMMQWAIIDGLSRLLTDQPLTAGEEEGMAPMQLLEQAELQGVDVSKGFVSYPNGEKRFEELWSGR